MTTLTQDNQTLLNRVIDLIPDSAQARFADQLNLNGEQFRQGLGSSLGKIITSIQDQEHETGFKASIVRLIPNLTTSQATSQLLQFNPSKTVDNTLEQMAQQLLAVVFGHRIESVADALSMTARISQPGALGVLNVAGAALLAFLGQNKTGLASALPWATPATFKPVSAPVSFPNTTNVGNTMSAAGAGMAAAGAATMARKPGRGLFGWLMPLLLVGLAAWGLMNLFSRKGVDEQAATAPAAAVKYVSAEPVMSVNNESLGRMVEASLPTGMTLNVPQNGIESKLLAFVQDTNKAVDKTTWFNFDRILFDSAKATLKQTSYQQLDNIAAILQAYPQVNLKIGGYTDSTGNKAQNQLLSGKRAAAVMTHLTGLGVAGNRLKAEGYGDQFPVASNDTPEGRAQNRRISVRVTQK
jgi:OmpA-OmpF porin, OOP family